MSGRETDDNLWAELPIEDDQFRFLLMLGQGSYGKVYKAVDKDNQEYCAVKVT